MRLSIGETVAKFVRTELYFRAILQANYSLYLNVSWADFVLEGLAALSMVLKDKKSEMA